MPDNVKFDVFLSHSSRDKEDVRRLARDLQSHGIGVWLDEWEILVGDPITQRLQAGLTSCRYLALWITKHALGSSWVTCEWHDRYHAEVTSDTVGILPLLTEDCELPPLIRGKKYADFREDYHSGLRELLLVFGVKLDDPFKSPASLEPQKIVSVSTASDLREIRRETRFLWQDLVSLTPYRRSCSSELRASTFNKVIGAMERLSAAGHFVTKNTPDGVSKSGEPIVRIYVDNISDQLLNLIEIELGK